MLTVDLNCDMGEGMINDEELMPFISSANIACGYHAGDNNSISKTVRLALLNNVAIGAHPGFNDKANFGRTEMNVTSNEVYDLMTEQVLLIRKICDVEGGVLHHVKPHGALYNLAARTCELAAALAKAVFDIDQHLILYGLSGSFLITEAQRTGLKTASEVFADRTYTDDGKLTPRSEPGALITNTRRAIEQVLHMVQKGSVTSLKNKKIFITAETICIHGDGAHALHFAKTIYKKLHQYNIEIKAPN